MIRKEKGGKRDPYPGILYEFKTRGCARGSLHECERKQLEILGQWDVRRGTIPAKVRPKISNEDRLHSSSSLNNILSQ